MDQEKNKLEPIFSVSEYIEFININLKKIGVAKIAGEVTRVTIKNGHVYFSIKDKSGSGVLDCIIWRGNYALCGVRLEEGMEVVLNGSPNIYPLSGRFSFIADTVELKGEGALKKAYDELKNKLTKEGIFDEEKKRAIPEFPEKIGIITSKEGAVIHDFLNNLGKYGFKIKMINSRVEGQEAVKDLLAAIKTLKKQDIDVLVVIRGGGSLESLQAFNNEVLVREIASFPKPVIAGIGHHEDVTLFALAADLAESTPTATAVAINQSWDMASNRIFYLKERIMEGFKDVLNVLEEKIKEIKRELVQALKEAFRKEEIVSFQEQIILYLGMAIKQKKQIIKSLGDYISLADPERNLKLGYSIVFNKNKKVVKKTSDVQIDEDISIKLGRGEIVSKVKKIV